MFLQYFLLQKVEKNGRMQHFCFVFLHKNYLTVPKDCVCCHMIRHDPSWLCPRRTRLYINYLGKVYGKNALDFHFWNPDHVSFLTSVLSSIQELTLTVKKRAMGDRQVEAQHPIYSLRTVV